MFKLDIVSALVLQHAEVLRLQASGVQYEGSHTGVEVNCITPSNIHNSSTIDSGAKTTALLLNIHDVETTSEHSVGRPSLFRLVFMLSRAEMPLLILNGIGIHC
jgi:hypothetical protein